MPNLYETILLGKDSDTWPAFTRFFTSEAEAKKFAHSHRRHGYRSVIKKCKVPDRLTIEQWISLLESDAPGNQDFKLSPIELRTYCNGT